MGEEKGYKVSRMEKRPISIGMVRLAPVVAVKSLEIR